MLKWCLLVSVILLILKVVGVAGISWLIVGVPLMAWFTLVVIIVGGCGLIIGVYAAVVAFINK